MQIGPTAVKLASFAGVTLIAGAAHLCGLGEHAAGWIGAAVGLIGAGAHAGWGHLFVDLVHDAAKRAGRGETAREMQNRDLHRLIGETIARVLEKEAKGTPGGKFGAAYLKRAAVAFRGAEWMEIKLTGTQTEVGEPKIPRYFTGDAEAIKQAPVLEQTAWVSLVQQVAGPATFREYDEALNYAATELREHFAFELLESFKMAWKKNDLAWPALILRLLSLIVGSTSETAKESGEIRKEMVALRDAVVKAAQPAVRSAPQGDLMLEAFRQYQDELISKLDRIEAKVDRIGEDVAAIRDAIQNPRASPVKERWIGIENTTKKILARDEEARALLDALRTDGPGIVSITTPPGFGKSAVFAYAVGMLRSAGDPPEAELNGIAVLNANLHPPGIAEFANVLGRITGLQEAAARFASATEHPDGSLRTLFFDLLRLCGKVWLVVENAETLLAPKADAGAAADFRDLLEDWCRYDHRAKLLVLTRHALYPGPQCHRSLQNVEEALRGGLPEDAAFELLRRSLADTRFAQAPETLLLQVVRKLHRVPMAIEQFAGYLRLREEGVELDGPFVEQNDLLRLPAGKQQILAITGENLKLLDAPSLALLRVVAWAATSVPRSGLMALDENAGELLTRLVRSSQLLAREGTAAEGRSFEMHPLIREALEDLPGGPGLDLVWINQVFLRAGNAELDKTQFRPALALYTLAERAARDDGSRDDLAAAIMGRGVALDNLGRLEEAVAAHDDAIAILRVLMEQEHRQELRNDLAAAIMNRGVALWNLGRLEEAVAAYDDAIAILRVLVEQEHRLELRNDLTLAVLNRGVALWNLGRLEEAVTAFDDAIAIRRVLVEQEHRQELRNDLAAAIMNRGVVLDNLGRLEEAVAAFEDTIGILRVLVGQEHRQELRNDLARAVMNRGVTLWRLGRLEEAVPAYDDAIGILRVLVEQEHRQELRNNLAAAIMNRGLALAGLGRLEEAVAAYDDVIAIVRALVEQEHRQELRNNLARVIMNRGIALRNLGRLAQAVAAFDDAIATYRVLVEQEHRQELRNGLARAFYNLALAHEKRNDMRAGLDAAREARKLREDLVKEGWKHLERNLNDARKLESRLTQRLR